MGFSSGIFWISKEDFATQFRVVSICLSDFAINKRSITRGERDAAEDRHHAAQDQIMTQFVAQHDEKMSSLDDVEFMEATLGEVAEKAAANLRQYSGYMTKVGTTHGAWLWKAGRKLHTTSDKGSWTTHVHESVVAAAAAADRAQAKQDRDRARRFVTQPNRLLTNGADLEFVQGTHADAAAKCEQNLRQYQGYMEKAGETRGTWLMKAGAQIVDDNDTGIWTVHLHETVANASAAAARAAAQETKARMKRFIKKTDYQMSATGDVEFMKGSLGEVAARVEANLRQYSGYVTKNTVNHGAWLWKAGNELHHSSDAGTWTTYVHKKAA